MAPALTLLAQSQPSSSSSSIQGMLESLSDGQLTALALVTVILSALVIMFVFAVVAGSVRSMRALAVKSDLAKLMLDRGMSATEIDQVIRSVHQGADMTACRSRQRNASLSVPPAKQVA